MKRFARLGLIVSGLIIGMSREGIVGTYGAYLKVCTGYSVSMPIDVGHLIVRDIPPGMTAGEASSKAESDALQRRQAEAEKLLKPFLKPLNAVVIRVIQKPHAFHDRLSAWDTVRATAVESDYQYRLPAPEIGDMREFELYLHMKPDQTSLRRQRTLAGFALAQVSLGGYLKQAPVQALTSQLDGAYYEALPLLILSAESQRDALEKMIQDSTQPADNRLRASLLLKALDNQAPSESDWKLAGGTDAWMWMLTLCPEKDLAAVQTRLEKDVRISDDDKNRILSRK